MHVRVGGRWDGSAHRLSACEQEYAPAAQTAAHAAARDAVLNPTTAEDYNNIIEGLGVPISNCEMISLPELAKALGLERYVNDGIPFDLPRDQAYNLVEALNKHGIGSRNDLREKFQSLKEKGLVPSHWQIGHMLATEEEADLATEAKAEEEARKQAEEEARLATEARLKAAQQARIEAEAGLKAAQQERVAAEAKAKEARLALKEAREEEARLAEERRKAEEARLKTEEAEED